MPNPVMLDLSDQYIKSVIGFKLFEDPKFLRKKKKRLSKWREYRI